MEKNSAHGLAVNEVAYGQIREALASSASLHSVLEQLVLTAEQKTGHGMLASVLLLDADGRRLMTGAAPNLPQAYNQAIHGIEIGPAVGSCGTAAFYGEAVFVTDIKRDPLWADFAEMALSHGLRACWSAPIKDASGRVLGTFANYYREARNPKPQDIELIKQVAGLAAEAIQAFETAVPA